MSILYESYAQVRLERGKTYKIGFHVKHYSAHPEKTRQTILSRLRTYNWFSHGLELQDAEVKATTNHIEGTLTLRVHQSFVAWPLIALLIPSILGFITAIVKLWLIKEVASPLLEKGPLGLPIIAWLFITAGGVLIPLAIILKR